MEVLYEVFPMEIAENVREMSKIRQMGSIHEELLTSTIRMRNVYKGASVYKKSGVEVMCKNETQCDYYYENVHPNTCLLANATCGNNPIKHLRETFKYLPNVNRSDDEYDHEDELTEVRYIVAGKKFTKDYLQACLSENGINVSIKKSKQEMIKLLMKI